MGRPAEGKGSGWFRFPHRVLRDYGPKVGPVGIAVYCSLASHLNYSGVSPRREEIAQGIGISLATVRRALKMLRELGLVEAVTRPRSPECAIYRLLEPPPATEPTLFADVPRGSNTTGQRVKNVTPEGQKRHPRGSKTSPSYMRIKEVREENKEEDPPKSPQGGESPQSSSQPPTFALDFLLAWNMVPQFVHARGLTGKRLRHFQARSRDRDWMEHWREALEKAARTPFCLGQNDRGWRATIDWFLRPDTLNRLLEGAYDWPRNGNGKPHLTDAELAAQVEAGRRERRSRLGIVNELADELAEGRAP